MEIIKKRTNARRILLTNQDMCDFSRVPMNIIDCFFGCCSYYKRLMVTTFGFINGINPYNLLRLVRWTDTSNSDILKIERLFKDLRTDLYQYKYRSYSVYFNCYEFCNGDLLQNGKRVPNPN